MGRTGLRLIAPGRAGQVLAPHPDRDYGDDQGGKRDCCCGQEPADLCGSRRHDSADRSGYAESSAFPA
jgi:hypothetical protein